MSNDLNKVMLIGRLGADPEMRHTAGGSAVTNMNLASNRSWKDKDSGQLKEETEWSRLVVFGRQAEVAGEYLKKGSRVFVEGRLQTRKWQDQGGNDRWTTEIVVNWFQMLDGRASEGGESRPQESPPSNAPGLDDDIPF